MTTPEPPVMADDIEPGLIRITATVQSAFALALTFLFPLAVRRRLQIV